jgi:hypothetical protein
MKCENAKRGLFIRKPRRTESMNTEIFQQAEPAPHSIADSGSAFAEAMADKMRRAERSETRYLVCYDFKEAACGGKGGGEGKLYTLKHNKTRWWQIIFFLQVLAPSRQSLHPL